MDEKAPELHQLESQTDRPEGDLPAYDDAETCRILRKADWRVIPCLAAMYLVSFIDRSNIGNAKVAGMNKDLHNIALTAFFIPYALLEIPCNVILKLTRPSIWMPSIMLAWGIVMTLTGIVKDFKGLVICRVFLGITESGFFPGATYLLTVWYRRYEVQTRMVVFYASVSLSGAFSGLLAYAIQHMEGIAHLGGWSWIFILEGLATIVIAICMYIFLPDGPATAKFLTQEEKRFIITRLETETGSGEGRTTNSDKLTVRQVMEALKEWRIYVAVVIYWGNTVAVYAFSVTIPTVIRDLGYSAANAQLMTIPVYVCAMICAVVSAMLSDRYKQRSSFILGACVTAALGLLALIASPHPNYPGLTYGFLFLAASGLYSVIVPAICWIANNLAPSGKRAVGMAMLISGGNLGGIVGSNIFLEREAPHYWSGYGVCLAVVLAAIVSVLVLRWRYKKDNTARDKMTLAEIRAKYTDDELVRLGDASPLWRYTL
ncbi:high-affinity nicotinic acid transporter [Purpureocillium lilacinum]|uniref:High-affinity nicotinic acid transporter n=1 Tax=Purpureocillium lilacinum TaxID=33203 RepID=A0A179GYP9_PURLI|nr:high-affinity nicotinic acid transporter [Purpureocillium lilacinum]OAQ82588.1 high-affinity nicotinic acid transporter [Purpureocillium lilacinum]